MEMHEQTMYMSHSAETERELLHHDEPSVCCYV